MNSAVVTLCSTVAGAVAGAVAGGIVSFFFNRIEHRRSRRDAAAQAVIQACADLTAFHTRAPGGFDAWELISSGPNRPTTVTSAHPLRSSLDAAVRQLRPRLSPDRRKQLAALVAEMETPQARARRDDALDVLARIQYRRTRRDQIADARGADLARACEPMLALCAEYMGVLRRIPSEQRPGAIVMRFEVPLLEAASRIDPLIDPDPRAQLDSLARAAADENCRNDRTHAMHAVRHLQQFVHAL